MNSIKKENKWGFEINRVSFHISRTNCTNIDFNELCKLVNGLKTDSMSNKHINLDKYLQKIMYSIRNYSSLSEMNIPKDFSLKHDRNSNIDYNNELIQFTNWIIVYDNLVKINSSDIKYLYHYSNLNLNHLTPTYGGLARHTFYSRPRIYCSKFPTAKNGFPLLISEKTDRELEKLDSYLGKLPNIKFNTNDRIMNKVFVLLKALIPVANIYKIRIKPEYNVYEDFEQTKENRKHAYFIETLHNIPITKVDNNKVLSMKYIKENFSNIHKFYLENYNMYRFATENKLYNNKLDKNFFSNLTNRLNRINFSNQGPLYHECHWNYFVRYVKQNKNFKGIHTSENEDESSRFKRQLCLTRNKYYSVELFRFLLDKYSYIDEKELMNDLTNRVVFIFDSDKLSQRYKVIPYSHHNNKVRNPSEFEERILTNNEIISKDCLIGMITSRKDLWDDVQSDNQKEFMDIFGCKLIYDENRPQKCIQLAKHFMTQNPNYKMDYGGWDR